jgi:hypothetical protein
MARLTISLIFIFVLFIQFNEQQAASIQHISTLDQMEDPSFSPADSSSLLNRWYQHLNEKQEDQQNNLEHIWKRFLPDLTQLRQRRRFGNTRYGRSLPTDSK